MKEKSPEKRQLLEKEVLAHIFEYTFAITGIIFYACSIFLEQTVQASRTELGLGLLDTLFAVSARGAQIYFRNSQR